MEWGILGNPRKFCDYFGVTKKIKEMLTLQKVDRIASEILGCMKRISTIISSKAKLTKEC